MNWKGVGLQRAFHFFLKYFFNFIFKNFFFFCCYYYYFFYYLCRVELCNHYHHNAFCLAFINGSIFLIIAIVLDISIYDLFFYQTSNIFVYSLHILCFTLLLLFFAFLCPVFIFQLASDMHCLSVNVLNCIPEG